MFIKWSFILKFLAIFNIFLAIYLISSAGDTPHNYFVRLGQAFLEGKYWLREAPPWLNELVPGEKNRYFVAYPPMPAIVALPFLIVFGKELPQQYLGHFLGAGIVLLTIKLSLLIKKDWQLAVWSGVLIGFGSIVWFLSAVGSAWYLSQITAAFFLTAALAESLGKKRALLVGLLVGSAYLSRLHTLLALPLFIYLISKKQTKVKVQIIKLFLGVAPFLLFNFFYNYLRFGVIWDKAYFLIPGVLAEPWYQKGIFSLEYLGRHLKTTFWSFPKISKNPPFITPSWSGLAIWITTPAFLYSLKAPIKKLKIKLAWLAIFLIAIPIFTHGTTGFSQFGYRFAVDFYPILLYLTINGVSGSPLKWHHFLLLAISVVVNLWGVLWINKFGWVNY